MATRSTADGQGHGGDAKSEISHMDEYDSDDEGQDIDELWYVMTPESSQSCDTNMVRFAV